MKTLDEMVPGEYEGIIADVSRVVAQCVPDGARFCVAVYSPKRIFVAVGIEEDGVIGLDLHQEMRHVAARIVKHVEKLEAGNDPQRPSD